MMTSSILIVSLCVTLIYGIQGLQITAVSINRLTVDGMDLTLMSCNPSFIPQSIERLKTELTDKSGPVGSLTVNNLVSSGSQTKMEATLSFTDFEYMKNFVSWVLNSTNPQDFHATVFVKSKIMNIFPYDYEKKYNFSEFSNSLFNHNGWSCQSKPNYLQDNDIRMQLLAIQSRFSVSELLYSDKNIHVENLTKIINQSRTKSIS